MGTNYYHYEKPPCECCKRPYEAKHIGKSSAGWCFTLHVYPGEGPENLAEWLKLFDTGIIMNEYGDVVPAAKMVRTIMNRGQVGCEEPIAFRDKAFLRSNHATPGPNGLLRHSIDGRHCIAHGEGTWDHYVGEFS